MRRCGSLLLFFLFFCAFAISIPQARAQVDRFTIAAGTDEDHALQEISKEQDPQKKLAMYQDFVQKFSANPEAAAYGNWQMMQAYQATGDLDKALEFADKALAGSPHNLEIVVSLVNASVQAKNDVKTMDYAAKGGAVCQSVTNQKKPDGMSDEEFTSKVNNDKAAAQSICEFLETSGFNAIATENDPKNRMAEIEEFTAAFPGSKFQDQVSNYAMYTLGPGQLNDPTRLVSFGEKTLAANPNSLPALLLLANFYGDDSKPGSAAKAVTYAQKAIAVANADAPDADKPRKISAGVAHNIIGFADLKQEKTASSIPELKVAVALLEGQGEDQQYARALYGLGFAYGKLDKLSEAREVLTEGVKIQSPWRAMSQDLLTKVNSARAKGK